MKNLRITWYAYRKEKRKRNEDIAFTLSKFDGCSLQVAHVGGLGEMKKHLVESTQLSSSVRFFFYCLLEVSLMQTQLVDAHYLIESRQKKKLFSKFHT